MGRGKFKGKPTGRRQFSTPEEMIAGTSASRPRTFRQVGSWGDHKVDVTIAGSSFSAIIDNI